MRWFRSGKSRVQPHHDPARWQALVNEARSRFGPHVRVPFSDQHDALIRLFDGDDGLLASVDVARCFADAAHAEVLAQVTAVRGRTGQQLAVQRRNYRPLWQSATGHLRWTLFTLPCGMFPYVHVAAAVTVIGSHARRVVQITDPEPLLAHLFEILDLTIVGWQYGGVRVDPDAAALANRLISAAQQIRAAMATPPPLPPPVRELMRSNASVDVCDPTNNRVVGAFNPGRQMREALLI